MGLFSRHIRSFVFLSLYYLWLGYNIFLIKRIPSQKYHCLEWLVGLFTIDIIVIVIYTIRLLGLIFTNSDIYKQDHLKILGLVYLPLIILAIYLFIK